MVNHISVRIQQPNGLELYYAADRIQYNASTKTMTLITGYNRKNINITTGSVAYVMNWNGSTIAVHRG